MKILLNIILIQLFTFSVLNLSYTQNSVKLSLVKETSNEQNYTWGDRYVELKSVAGELVGYETYKKFYYLKYQKKYFTKTEIIWLSGDTISFGPYGETFVSPDQNTIVKYGYYKGDTINDFKLFFYNHEGTLLNEIKEYYKKQPTVFMANNGLVGTFGQILDDENKVKAIDIYDVTGKNIYQKQFDTLLDVHNFKISQNLKMFAYDYDQFDIYGNHFNNGIVVKNQSDSKILELEFNKQDTIQYYRFFKDNYFIMKTSKFLVFYSFPVNQLWSHSELYENAERFEIIENKNICLVVCSERLTLSQWDTDYYIYALDLNSGSQLASYKLEGKGPIFDSDEVISVIDDYNFKVQIHNEIFYFNITY